MSHVLVKLQKKGTMVLPRRLREMAGLTEGTLMKVDVLEGPRFLVTPQVADRDLVTSKPKNRKEAFRELAQVVAELRQEAKEKGINKMTKQEIHAAVAAMRRDLKKTSKRSAK